MFILHLGARRGHLSIPFYMFYRARFESVVSELIQKCTELIDKVLKEGNVSRDDIDKVSLLTVPRRYFFCGSFMFLLSCVCYAFVCICLFVPCGHLLGKG